MGAQERGSSQTEVPSPRHGDQSQPQASGPDSPRGVGAVGKGGGGSVYLRVLHQVAAALEPVVELGHPPGSNDLDVGQESEPGALLLASPGPRAAELASLLRGRRLQCSSGGLLLLPGEGAVHGRPH